MHYVQRVPVGELVIALLSSENCTPLREQSWFQWVGFAKAPVSWFHAHTVLVDYFGELEK